MNYDPPLVGFVYKRHPKDKKRHAYNIVLNGLINLSDSKKIT